MEASPADAARLSLSYVGKVLTSDEAKDQRAFNEVMRIANCKDEKVKDIKIIQKSITEEAITENTAHAQMHTSHETQCEKQWRELHCGQSIESCLL